MLPIKAIHTGLRDTETTSKKAHWVVCRMILYMIIVDFQLSDQQYVFMAIKACASRRDWKSIDDLLTVKVCMLTSNSFVIQ